MAVLLTTSEIKSRIREVFISGYLGARFKEEGFDLKERGYLLCLVCRSYSISVDFNNREREIEIFFDIEGLYESVSLVETYYLLGGQFVIHPGIFDTRVVRDLDAAFLIIKKMMLFILKFPQDSVEAILRNAILRKERKEKFEDSFLGKFLVFTNLLRTPMADLLKLRNLDKIADDLHITKKQLLEMRKVIIDEGLERDIL